ncbi:MAG: NAD(P)/FAD-dependent oxidoreductase [Bacteroidota bacterium]|nr:NAD(P)/FAD-dependent oxidoreductase [Bacteroidota bacterium]MDP4190419.1 NAD(P)/FAD-dependent oxidoreductase [Bacteroidota bacterium]MDP4194558.1 NAD(P)/FAD-dependent oxidoreductase [Bacteroidota bacterium]
MKDQYDIVVVGAGPAGSMAARFAAEKGVSVLLLEKDRDVGYPVRCAEAVVSAGLEEFISPDKKWIASEINKFSLFAPDNTEVVLEFPFTGFVLERRIFDYELAKQAASFGTDVLTRAYVNGLLFDGNKVCGVKFEHRGEQKQVKAKVVIAADGVESRVGRWAGLKTHVDFREMESCAQVTISNINVKADTCYFYFGKDVSPNGYLWVFPKGDSTANVGLGVSGLVGKNRSALSYLNEFLETNFPGAPVLTSIAGGVPCSITLEKISAPGIMLVGDAARQVNPISGGGIISGMRGGRIAGRIAAESILSNKPDHIFSYDKEWHEKVGKKHEASNRLKEGVFNFSDEKLNNLAHSFLKVPMEKRTLGNLCRTALINQPSLLFDIAKVFFV